MSESSLEKTKRKYSRILLDHSWHHQISIFYKEYSDCEFALIHKPKITRYLMQKYPQHAFLYRLQLKNTEKRMFNDLSPQGKIEAPYHTIHSSKKIRRESLLEGLTEALKVDFKLLTRPAHRAKVEKASATIKGTAPHNLERYFGTNKPIRRYSVIGKENLILYIE